MRVVRNILAASGVIGSLFASAGVKEVRLGGRRKSGTISAARFPDYVTGPGEAYVKPLAASVLIP